MLVCNRWCSSSHCTGILSSRWSYISEKHYDAWKNCHYKYNL